MLTVLFNDKIDPEKLSLEDFETSRELIAMFPNYYRALVKKRKIDKSLIYQLKLEDFKNVKITRENEHVFQDLLYERYGDPSDPNNRLDDDYVKYPNLSSVTEMLFPLDKRVKEYEIWWCRYPFRNSDHTFKERPCLVWNTGNGLQAIQLSSYDENDPRKVARLQLEWVDLLTDWNTSIEGLEKPTMVISNTCCNLRNVHFLYRCGNLTSVDIMKVKMLLVEADKAKFNTVFNLKEWLLSNYVTESIAKDGSGNNNHNKLQNLQDITRSKQINCVDLATAVHTICTQNRIEHWMVISQFYLSDRSIWEGHVYTIFRTWSKSLRILDYYADDKDPCADFRTYLNKSVKEVAQIEADNLKLPMLRILKASDAKINNIILDSDKFPIWDSYVSKRKTQEELLNRFVIV